MSDIYDQAIDQQPVAPTGGGDKYDAAIDQQRDEQKTNIKQSLFVAGQRQPDRQAQVLELAKKYKVPTDFADRNFDELNKSSQAVTDNYDKIINDTPGLAKYLENHDNATLSKDDLDQLAKVEGNVQDHGLMHALGEALKFGSDQAVAQLSRVPGFMGDLATSKMFGGRASPPNAQGQYPTVDPSRVQTPDTLYINQNQPVPQNGYGVQQQNPYQQFDRQASMSMINNPVAQEFDERAQAHVVPEMSESATDSISKGDYSKAGRVLAVQFAQQAPNLAAIIASAMANPAIGTAYVASTTGAETNKRALESGASHDAAATDAAIQGTVMASLDQLGTFGILKEWEHVIAAQYGKQVSRETFKALGQTLVHSVTAQGGQQAVGSFANDFSDYITGVNPDALNGTFQRAADAGLLGVVTGAAMVAPAGAGLALGKRVGSSVHGEMSAGEEAKPTHQFTPDEARSAALARDTFTQLADNIKESKTFARSPEAVQSFLTEATKGSQMESVYIPVDAAETYLQSQNIIPAEFFQKMGQSKAFDEAHETGLIKVPTSVFATAIANSEHAKAFADFVSFDPEKPNAKQVQDDHVRVNEQLQAEADKALGTQEEPKPDGATKIEQSLSEQMTKAGLPERVAKHESKLWGAFYRTQAEALGITPEEVFTKFPINIDDGKVHAPTLEEASSMGQGLIPPANGFFETNGKPEAVNVLHISPEEEIAARSSSVDRAGVAAEQKLQGMVVINSHTNDEITLTKQNFRQMARGQNSLANRVILPNLDTIMKNAIYDGEDQFKASRNLKGMSRYYALVSFDGADHLVRMRVADTPQGKQLVGVETKRLAGTLGRQGTEAPGYTANGKASVVPIGTFAAAINHVRNSSQLFQDGSPNSSKAQLEQGARGALQIHKDGTFNLSVFKGADASTAIHEFMHYALEVTNRLAGEGHDLHVAQMDGFKSYWKENSAHILEVIKDQAKRETDPATKLRSDLMIRDIEGRGGAEYIAHQAEHFGEISDDTDRFVQTQLHEYTARAFEQYARTGQAPSDRLKQAFRKFKSWLVSIYRNAKQLETNLSPQVREVFDRMLATEDEVDQARGRIRAQPLFSGDLTHHMSEEQAGKYRTAIENVRAEAAEKLTAEIHADDERMRSAEMKKVRGEIQDRITKEVNEMPVYRALEILTKGKNLEGERVERLKIDRTILEAEFGKDAVEQMPDRTTSKKDGVSPQAAAEILGYESADHLIMDLTRSMSKDDMIHQMTDAEMRQNHPTLLESGKIGDEAMKVIHSESRAKLLMMEMELLLKDHKGLAKDAVRRIARRMPTNEVVKEQATKVIGDRQVSDLKPGLFIAAEKKAAAEAGKHLANGDLEAAFDAKRRELLNHELYKAVIEAQQIREKASKFFKKFNGKDEELAKTRDMDIVNAGRAILAQFGASRTDKPADHFLEKMKAYDPEGFEVINGLVKDATKNVVPLDQMKFDDFVALRDTVKALWDLAKSNREMEIDGKKVDKAQIITDLTHGLDEFHDIKPTPGKEKELTKLQKWQSDLLGFKASLRRVESWSRLIDKGERGAFTKYFVEPIMEATTKWRLDKKAKLDEFLSIIKPIEKNLRSSKTIAAPELNYTFTNLAQLLGAVLHTGNESNLEKLLLGRGWGKKNEDGTFDRTRWDRFIERMYKEGQITKAHMDVVQGIWDQMERIKPEAQKAHKAMYGFYFNEITANKIDTPFGEYRGGYVPALVDNLLAEDAQMRADKEALSTENNSFMFPSTGRGFSKSRVDSYHAPLVMDIRAIPSHIDKVTRFTNIQPVVKSLARIAMDKGFRARLGNLDQHAASEMIIPYLQRAATQKVQTPAQGAGGRFMDSMAGFIRRRASLLTMTWNVVNGIQNFSGVFPALTMVDKGEMARALMHSVLSPKESASMVAEKSDFMKTRMEKTAAEIQGEVEEIIGNPNAFEKGRSAAVQYGYLFQKVTQDFMDKMAWVAGYNQALSEGNAENLAIKYADSVVRLTQADMAPESISKFETGSATARMFKMFSGYFNTQANLQLTEQGLAREIGGFKGGKRAFYVYLAGYAAPAFATALIAQAFDGKWDENDDGSVMDDLVKMFFGSQVRYALAMMPVAGPIAQGTYGFFTDKAYDDKISMSPAINLIERSAKGTASVVKAIRKGDKSKVDVQDAITAIGAVTGLPTGIVSRPANYLKAIDEGKARPANPLDYARGIVTGRPGAK